jgi:hypothetical protein
MRDKNFGMCSMRGFSNYTYSNWVAPLTPRVEGVLVNGKDTGSRIED